MILMAITDTLHFCEGHGTIKLTWSKSIMSPREEKTITGMTRTVMTPDVEIVIEEFHYELNETGAKERNRLLAIYTPIFYQGNDVGPTAR